MKRISLLVLLLMNLPLFAQQQRIVVTDDIANFWKAYDKIVATKDSTQHLKLIQDWYISKGTPGLKGIIEARRYSPEGFVYAIHNYPNFWNSIRENTLKANQYAAKIETGIAKLRKLYPELKPANVYFTIGALRTGGTTLRNNVLIGCEISMTDNQTVWDELDAQYPYLKDHFATDPIEHLDFLNVHEYIHTQQKTTIGTTLLAQTVIEGVAEFLAEKALETQSPNPQIAYGKTNESRLKPLFTKSMFNPDFGEWLWSIESRKLGMKDLAYSIGYAICEKYYLRMPNKAKAIRDMIQLDYGNEETLFKFVDDAQYFDKPIKVYKDEYESARPVVTSIEPFTNNSQSVDAKTKTITVHFSEPMDPKTRGFGFGPLGERNVLRVHKIIGYSEDRKSFRFEVNLEPGTQYQSVVTESFKDEEGYSLKPFLIDFKTLP